MANDLHVSSFLLTAAVISAEMNVRSSDFSDLHIYRVKLCLLVPQTVGVLQHQLSLQLAEMNQLPAVRLAARSSSRSPYTLSCEVFV